jgi:hypothetical protein
MTPFEIGIALHYYSRTVDCDEALVPIGPSTMKWFVDNGLLTEHFGDRVQHYHPTEKLRTYCDALQKIPLPVQVWVLP